jgi:hypothetical protein
MIFVDLRRIVFFTLLSFLKKSKVSKTLIFQGFSLFSKSKCQKSLIFPLKTLIPLVFNASRV